MMRIGMMLGLIAILAGHAGAELTPGTARLTLQAFDPGKNLVTNGSFETEVNGIPTGWLWDRRNTDATLTFDTQNPHTGRASIKITNGTAFGAHVFGTLWVATPIPVKPNTRYTYSASVKTAGTLPGVWIGGGGLEDTARSARHPRPMAADIAHVRDRRAGNHVSIAHLH